MSSRRSRKSASNRYPTKWSEWAWSDQLDCNTRYREKGDNDWEWEYESGPVLADSEGPLTASTESACLDPSGQQPRRKQDSGDTSQLNYDNDTTSPDSQGRVYNTQDTLQQGELPKNGMADITNGLSQTTLNSYHDHYPHDDYTQDQYFQGYSPYTPSCSQPVYAQQPYEPSREKKMDTIRARDSHNKHKVLDYRYKIHKASEFQIGQVFEIPWDESNSKSAPDHSMLEFNGDITDSKVWNKYDSYVIARVRKFVVVDAGNDEGHSICLPIKSYGHQGVTKHGVRPQDHAVIYSSKRRGPVSLPGESNQGLMTLEPIRVELNQTHLELDELSRLNYANPHTVEYNVKVCFIGRVAKHYERQLRKDFALINAHDESNSINERDMNQSVDATSEVYPKPGGLDERYRPKNGSGYVQVTAEGGQVFRDYGGQYEDQYGGDGGYN